MLNLLLYGSGLVAKPLASYCSGFSCCKVGALGCLGLVVTAGRLSSCGTRLTCHAAGGIFLDQRPDLCPLHWQVDSQPLDHQGNAKCIDFYIDPVSSGLENFTY